MLRGHNCVTVHSLTAVNRNDIDSFLCPNIEFNLDEISSDPEQLVSCRLIVRGELVTYSLRSTVSTAQCQSTAAEEFPITFLLNESGAQWSMMGLIYFHSVDNYRSLCPSLQLMELVRGEDVKQCNLNAMNYVSLVSCAPSFCSHQWISLLGFTLTDCQLLRKTLPGLETLRKWWLGQEEESSELRDNDLSLESWDRKVKVRRLGHCLRCSKNSLLISSILSLQGVSQTICLLSRWTGYQ